MDFVFCLASGDDVSVMETSVDTNMSVTESEMSMNDSLFSPTITEKRRRGWPKGVPRRKKGEFVPKVLIEAYYSVIKT